MAERPNAPDIDRSEDRLLQELQQEQRNVRTRARRLLKDYREFIKTHPEGRSIFFRSPEQPEKS